MRSQRSLIQLEGFDGPFDLLLELIRERKLDVSALSLREITDDFLIYLKGHRLKPEFLGDFLVVAATLLLVKARTIMGTLAPEEEEEIEQLTRRLTLYREFREQARWMAERWGRRPLLSASAFGPAFAQRFHLRQGYGGQVGVRMPSLTPQEMQEAMQYIVEKLPKPIQVHLQARPRGKSLSECLSLFWSRLQKLKRLVFQHVVASDSKQDIAVSFLAVLELARQRRVELFQAAPDEEIIITTS